MNDANAPQTPDHILAQWDESVRTGAKTTKKIAAEHDLTPNAVHRRLARYRTRLKKKRRPNGRLSHADTLQTEAERDELLNQLMQSIIETQDALEDLDERQPVVTVELPDDKPVLVAFFSDLHIGGAGVDHQQMQQDFKTVRDTPGCYAAILGDHCDNFSPKVLPSGMLEQIANPDLQWELTELFLRRYLTPTKLLAGVEGNHDAFSSAVGLSPCRSMYRRLQVPHLGAGGRLWLKFGSETYKMELRHDFPFKSSLNTTNSQRRLAEFVLGADVVALGHLHYPDLQHAWKAGTSQVWLRCSTYKRRDEWSASKGLQFGYAPPPMDFPGVILWPEQHKALPFRRFQDGLAYLRALIGGGGGGGG